MMFLENNFSQDRYIPVIFLRLILLPQKPVIHFEYSASQSSLNYLVSTGTKSVQLQIVVMLYCNTSNVTIISITQPYYYSLLSQIEQ